MKNIAILLLSFFFFSGLSHADAERAKSLFQKVSSQSKGPFGLNVIQTEKARISVLDILNGSPIVGKVYFQAAYRNLSAKLLENENIYLGNLFSTTYFELYAKHIIKNPGLDFFKMDDVEFQNNANITPELTFRLQQTLIEKYYTQRNPKSRLARAFFVRGISGAEFEEIYYYKLLSQLISNSEDHLDRLLMNQIQLMFDLSGDSGSISLSMIRKDIALLWDDQKSRLEEPHNSRLRTIRNEIHNAMSILVIDKINQFLKYKNLKELQEIKKDIIAYYSVSAKNILSFIQLKKIEVSQTLTASLNNLSGSKTDFLDLLSVANETIDIKDRLLETKNIDYTHLLNRINQFVLKSFTQIKLNELSEIEKTSRSLIHMALANGFLSEGEWENVIKAPITSPIWKQSIGRAYRNIVESLSPSLDSWKILNPEIEGILDHILKSSPFTLLDNLLQKVPTDKPQSNKIIKTKGKTYGYLVYITKQDIVNETPKFLGLTEKDIPVFEVLPLYLGVTAGVITEEEQTELSHIKLKTDARGTPNLYYKGAKNDPLFSMLLKENALIEMDLKEDGSVSIKKAKLEEAEEFWKRQGEKFKIKLFADLSETRIRSTRDLSYSDFVTVGSKAANYGELSKKDVLGSSVVLEGLGIPYFYYSEFLDLNPKIKAYIKAMLKEDHLKKMKFDRLYRNKVLLDLQDAMESKSAVMNKKLIEKLEKLLSVMYFGKSIRFRSSTNAEDLDDFNGAGLYSSTSYDPSSKKKTVSRALKKVWASIWNLRAFDEREFFGIDHSQVYMGILVSPGFPNQEGEGVAVTKNLKEKNPEPAVYVNVQKGEDHSIMNPTNGVLPDEFLTYYDPITWELNPIFKIKYLRNSTLLGPGEKSVMTDEQINQLTILLLKAHFHFKKILKGGVDFAMDFEFKLDDEHSSNGQVQIQLKQARPFVNSK